ncbi:Ubiquinone biosynthesis O-methyltransferase, mitochondrial [subsurface metagenome]
MQERYRNREVYFDEQAVTSEKYVLSFINEVMDINENTSILEIGCGEGGNLKPFLDIGCRRVVGVDMSRGKIENARNFFSDYPNKKNIEFVLGDIYDIQELGQFDIIITRDVLEHIHGQERFMQFVKIFLKPEGKIFLGFPPWHNPFGGHQQMCESRFLSNLPYFHILPTPIYRFILKAFGESDSKIQGLLEIKETGITIERFERILIKTGYRKDKRIFYFINPNYEVKFGLKSRKQLKLFSAIPYLRNFIITSNYYIISQKNS